MNYGAYGIGVFELIVSILFLLPGALWILSKTGLTKSAPDSSSFHSLGGIMASAVMAGAIFFHLFSPLGIEVLNNGESDGGSLFYASVAIFIAGIVLFMMNGRQIQLKW